MMEARDGDGGFNLLLRENEQLKADLAAARAHLEEVEGQAAERLVWTTRRSVQVGLLRGALQRIINGGAGTFRDMARDALAGSVDDEADAIIAELNARRVLCESHAEGCLAVITEPDGIYLVPGSCTCGLSARQDEQRKVLEKLRAK